MEGASTCGASIYYAPVPWATIYEQQVGNADWPNLSPRHKGKTKATHTHTRKEL